MRSVQRYFCWQETSWWRAELLNALGWKCPHLISWSENTVKAVELKRLHTTRFMNLTMLMFHFECSQCLFLENLDLWKTWHCNHHFADWFFKILIKYVTQQRYYRQWDKKTCIWRYFGLIPVTLLSVTSHRDYMFSHNPFATYPDASLVCPGYNLYNVTRTHHIAQPS